MASPGQGIFAEENRKWWTLAAVSFGLFMIMLDNTVVNVALPSIRKDLGISVSELEWVVNAYLLAAAALTAHAGHNHLAVRQQDLVVLTGGHMRAWVGKAYLKSLLPANFPVDDLK